MLRHLKYILLVCGIAFSIQSAIADHIAGGYFSYTCIGGDTYQICLNLYRDCSGLSVMWPSYNSNTATGLLIRCGAYSAQYSLTLDSVIPEVSQLCPQQLPFSSCNTSPSVLKGYKLYRYCGIVRLNSAANGACTNWELELGACCRGTSTNVIGQPVFHYRTSLNQTIASCPNNNSPIITAQPIPYVCAGQAFNYNPGVVEPDGDSLVYALIPARVHGVGGAIPFVNYQTANSFSGTQPLGTTGHIAFNSATGQMSFTPTMPGNYIVAMEICEWRNGQPLGCVEHEFQIVVINCNNSPPFMPVGIDSLQGSVRLQDSLTVVACHNDSFSFSILFYDSLLANQVTGDSVFISTNLGQAIPSADVDILPGNPAWLRFKWRPPPNAALQHNFVITIRDNACPVTAINMYNVSILLQPKINAGADITICGYNDSAHIQVMHGDSFFWSLIAGDSIVSSLNFSDTSLINGSVVWAKPAFTTSYRVTSNWDSVCKNVDTVTVFVRELDLPNDTALCRGDTFRLNVFNTTPCAGGAGEQFTWSPTIGLSNPNVRNPLLTVQANQNTTQYQVVYDDGCGCQISGNVIVQVSNIDTPLVTLNKYRCIPIGEINVQPVGGFAPFEFSIDSGTHFFSHTFFDSLDIGVFNILVRDSLGCVSPLRIDTLPDPGAPELDSFSIKHETCYNTQDGEIELFASGGVPPYTFSIDSGATFQTSPLFTGLGEGKYFLQIRDDSLCRTIPYELDLLGNPEIFIDSITSVHLACFNDSSGHIQVFASGGSPPLMYSIDSGLVFQASGVFSALSAGNYSVLVQDSVGCLSSPQARVLNEPPLLQFTMQLAHDTCFGACGGKATVSATGGVLPYTYNWFGQGVNQSVSNNLCAGNYSFSLTDHNGCLADTVFTVLQPTRLTFDSLLLNNPRCFGEQNASIEMLVSGGVLPYTYSFDGGTSFGASNKLDSLGPGSYRVMVRDSGNRCSHFADVVLVEPQKLKISAPQQSFRICQSTCADVHVEATGGNGPNYSYVWLNAPGNASSNLLCPLQDTQYLVFAEDSRACLSDTIGIHIQFFDSLRLQINNDTAICFGDTVALKAIVQGGTGGGYNYLWSPASQMLFPFSANAWAFPSQTTSYVLSLSDTCGSPPVTDSVRITVHPLPEPTIVALDSNEGCEPYSFTLLHNGWPGDSCIWQVGSRIKRTGNPITLSDFKRGDYDVTLKVVSAFGCEKELEKPSYIRVHKKPIPHFEMDPAKTDIFNTEIRFYDKSSADVIKWHWNFAGLDESDEINPRYTFPMDSGNFWITLRVENEKECDSTSKALLQIQSAHNMFIPNAFTPNGDGINDVFTPIGTGLDPRKYSFVVYDRWGKLVFESKRLNEGWDGTVIGSNLPAAAGVYVWQVYANDVNDTKKSYEYTGKVTLIR